MMNWIWRLSEKKIGLRTTKFFKYRRKAVINGKYNFVSIDKVEINELNWFVYEHDFGLA